MNTTTTKLFHIVYLREPHCFVRHRDENRDPSSNACSGLPEILDHAPENLVELDGRSITYQLADFGDLGDSPRHVLEAGLVGLLVRNHDDRRIAAGHLLDSLRQLADRDLGAVSDVEDLADRPGLVDQGYHSLHHVSDVSEAARLRAVAEHRDRL